jgi:hypothetical protein
VVAAAHGNGTPPDSRRQRYAEPAETDWESGSVGYSGVSALSIRYPTLGMVLMMMLGLGVSRMQPADGDDAVGERLGVLASYLNQELFGADYVFTRSPDTADLSMAAMTSWRRTASAKSGTV